MTRHLVAAACAQVYKLPLKLQHNKLAKVAANNASLKMYTTEAVEYGVWRIEEGTHPKGQDDYQVFTFTRDKEIIWKLDYNKGLEIFMDANFAREWDPDNAGDTDTTYSRTGFLIKYANYQVF